MPSLVRKGWSASGCSSGANVAAAYEVAKKLGSGKKIVTISPDSGEKYLSLNIYGNNEG